MFGFFKKKRKEYNLESLASEVVALASEHEPDRQFFYDKKSQMVVSRDGQGIQVYLGNIFNAVKHLSPEARREYLLDFFKASASEFTSDIIKTSLVTRVRTRA